MEIKEIESIIEGVLFAAGDPVPVEKLSEILGLDKKTTRLILDNMAVSMQNSRRGLMIREIDGCYQLCTRPEHFEYIRKLAEPRQKQALSQAAYETLAIIAYNQPVTRARIEMIRGVNSDSAITRLIERNLVREAGRLDTPGRPLLYETTEEFLRSFGFKSLRDLPIIEIDNLSHEETKSSRRINGRQDRMKKRKNGKNKYAR
ncbi:MAG: SMC-Scp complex subunit ScpB [Acetivibrionales bacterium]